MRIGAICGSLAQASVNRSFLHRVVALARGNFDVVLIDSLRSLPLFNPDDDARPPQAVTAWRADLERCDALLFATPEYSHSLPGPLKNAIDWTVSSGQLCRKVVALTSSVKIPDRATRGLRALRDTLVGIDSVIVWNQPILFSSDEPRELERMLAALAHGVAENSPRIGATPQSA